MAEMTTDEKIEWWTLLAKQCAQQAIFHDREAATYRSHVAQLHKRIRDEQASQNN